MIRFTFDVETADKGSLWSYGPGFNRLAGYSLARPGASGAAVVTTTDFDHVQSFVTDPCGYVIEGHNILGYDLLALQREFGRIDTLKLALDGRLRDTMLLARLDDPPLSRNERPVTFYDLDTVCERYGVEGKHGDLKAMAKKWGGYDKIPTDDPEYDEYLRADVVAARELGEQLPMTDYALREHKVAGVAANVMLTGFRVDNGLLPMRAKEELEKKAQALRTLAEEFGVVSTSTGGKPAKTLNTDAGRLSLARAFKRLGVTKQPPRTPTGKYATSADAMELMREQWGHLKGLKEMTGLVDVATSARSIYDSISKHVVGDRVHPRISIGLASGRWASSDPNLLGVGKRGGKVRERDVFLPDEGEVLVCLDLAQIEARAVAALSGDDAYLDLFVPGNDAHSMVAEMIFGDIAYRDTAKACHHAYNYGAEPPRIAIMAGVPLSVAEKFHSGMKDSFPDVAKWRDEMREIASSGQMIDNGFGRLMRPDPDRAWTTGPAMPGQGCGRDLMMEGILRLPAEMLRMLRCVVHDEAVMSVRPEDAEEVAHVVKDALSFHWVAPGKTRGVDVVADLPKRFGKTWGDCYA